jgi:SAM-dependent methyltransferase
MLGCGIDIGYRGSQYYNIPVLNKSIGVDLDYPGYDGVTLPFNTASLDYVFSSHCLEHIDHSVAAIRDWFRVLRTRGHLIICVPHQFLYEKKRALPSRFNEDHKRFYTPGVLLREIEEALEPNTYRLRSLQDNDIGFNYGIPPEQHANGCYEIECVIQKIEKPSWEIL